MTHSKIDITKLNRMLTSGKSVKDCAKHFSVTPSAISQAKKNLSAAVVKNVALENAHLLVGKNLNAVDQLQKINDDANEILDLLMRWQRGDNEALQILEQQRKVRIGKDEEEVVEYKLKDPRELALKAMAEIRGQLRLQLEIFQSLYDMKAVEEFQREVIDVIGSVSSDVRNQIVNRLGQKRALRTVIKF